MTEPNIIVKQLLWRCRRGMLELDMLLMPFCERYYLSLSPQQQQDFENLLNCDDTEILAWFNGEKTPADANIAAIVAQIKQAKR